MTSSFRTRPVAIGGAVLFAGCMVLSACSGNESSATSNAPAAAHARAALGPGTVNGASGSYGGTGVPTSAGDLSRKAVETARLLPTDQSIIYTAALTIRAPDIAAATRKAISIAVAAGGYTAGENAASGPNGKPGGTVSLTLKIPVAAYQSVLAQLSGSALGKQISLRQQATDVTQQVADVNSLVSSQRAAISALQGLLKKAASVSGLLQVQQQISQDESTLNSLLAQQRSLDHETTYATVNMTLVSPHPAVKHAQPAKHNFVSGLAAGWRAFRHAVGWGLTALGVMLPFLISALVLAGIGYGGRRVVLRRRAKPTPAS
ncbi:MAG TPA: DUF4349 domain-containing protein [Streptosporangiaceae bacterium]|nr:DUF4349 domain-containing protein [Streptosporangiaceae bacterium]